MTAYYSIHEISKKLGKAYPYINKKVNYLIDKQIFKQTQVGRSKLCSVNLESEKSIALLTLNEIDKKEKLVRSKRLAKDLLDDIKGLFDEFHIHTVLYIEGKVTFVLDYKHDKDAIQNLLAKQHPQLQFLDKREFLKFAVKSWKSLRNCTVLSSYENYYRLLRQVEGDIKIKYSIFK